MSNLPPQVTTELSPPQELQNVMLDDLELLTNVPQNVTVFNYDRGRQEVTIIPSATDSLEEGSYTIQSEDQSIPSDIDFDATVPIYKEISLKQTEKGKMINANSISESVRSTIEILPNIAGLMGQLGFTFETKTNSYDGTQYDSLLALPTPETFKENCRALGIDVELFQDDGLIPPKQYVQSYSEGKYPVATGVELYYVHDIRDDHITGVVLGGDELRDAHAEVSQSALSSNDEELIGQMAGGIDSFTNTLRSVIADGGTLGEAYGTRMGRSTLYRVGKNIGLSNETVEAILLKAQERAISFGIQIKELEQY